MYTRGELKKHVGNAIQRSAPFGTKHVVPLKELFIVGISHGPLGGLRYLHLRVPHRTCAAVGSHRVSHFSKCHPNKVSRPCIPGRCLSACPARKRRPGCFCLPGPRLCCCQVTSLESWSPGPPGKGLGRCGSLGRAPESQPGVMRGSNRYIYF